jgi:thiol-disulfide isomerase/thioredoxin
MKRITVAVAAMSVLATAAFGAQQWKGLTDENYYSGPKITADDLAGKVVLVDEWGINCPPCRALLPFMQKLWNANKDKNFVLIGSHRQGREVAKVKELVDANKMTYPVYDYAGIAEEPANGGGLPFMYVVNHRGKVIYSGRDADLAFAEVQAAILAVNAPPSLCDGVQFQAFKPMSKQLVLGKSIKSQVKTLEAAVKKGNGKNPTAVQQKQAEEAQSILDAINTAKTDLKEEIEAKKATNPEEALKLVKAYITTFPAEGAAYKPELPELSAKAAEWKKAQKAAK